jgi:cytochrome c553
LKRRILATQIVAFSLSLPLAAGAQQQGASSFGDHCAACHGDRGQGGSNIPALTTPAVQQKSEQALFDFITKGNVSNGMPSWAQLPEAERHQLVAFVKALPTGATATPTTAATTAPFTAPPPTLPFTDFRYESPGTIHKVTVADLPQPFATESAGNGPKVVPRPEGRLQGRTLGRRADQPPPDPHRAQWRRVRGRDQCRPHPCFPWHHRRRQAGTGRNLR